MRKSFTDHRREFVRGISNLGNHEALGKLGDTTSPRILLLSLMTIAQGIVSAFVALILSESSEEKIKQS